jgi:hypothetical protein
VTETDPAYEVFRPRRARRVAFTVAVTSIALFTVLAIFGPEGSFGWKLPDRIALVAFGCVIAAIMWRYASLRAEPSPAGLIVRNLATTRRLDWAEIVTVHLIVGAPWVTLDLADGDDMAVMAIQKADGDLARTEASRLAALVAAHAAVEPDPN